MTDAPMSCSVPDLLRLRVQQSPDLVAYAFEIDDGWQEITWRGFWQRVNALANGLQRRGLEPGDHVGLLAPTGLVWELLHHAILLAGGVVVGLESHDTAERLQWIADHAELKLLCAGSPALLAKIRNDQRRGYKLVVLITGENERDGIEHLVSLAEVEAGNLASGSTVFTDPGPSSTSAATLIYTSGTTGQPKGILYRHDQLVIAVRAIVNAYPSVPVGARFVCWLPLSNLFQRIMNLASMHAGGSVHLVSDPLGVMKVLPLAKPDVFIGVPRFYEKLHAGIEQEISRKPKRTQRFIRWAIAVGDRHARAKRHATDIAPLLRLQYLIAKHMVLDKLCGVLGGRVRFMMTGSAPTPLRLIEFFDAIGLPLFEAYGMSENVVPVALNRPEEFRFGTVGKPLAENRVAIDLDNELLVRGDGVFTGYFRDDRSAQAFTEEGYYRTGDYASLDEDGFLRLQGRKSEIIKTSTGRRISPIGIESTIESITYVDRAIVVGSGRKCLSAFLTLDKTALEERLRAAGVAMHDKFPQSLPADIVAVVERDLSATVSTLAEHERPAGYVILSRPLSIETGELTSNLKIRRHIIEQNHVDVLDELFASLEQPPTRLLVIQAGTRAR